GTATRSAPLPATATTLNPARGDSASRTRIGSVLRVPAQEPELKQREDENQREEHPGHGRGGAEVEEVLAGRLVEVLHDRARGIARSALGEDEHLPEDLGRADHVGDED